MLYFYFTVVWSDNSSGGPITSGVPRWFPIIMSNCRMETATNGSDLIDRGYFLIGRTRSTKLLSG